VHRNFAPDQGVQRQLPHRLRQSRQQPPPGNQGDRRFSTLSFVALHKTPEIARQLRSGRTAADHQQLQRTLLQFFEDGLPRLLETVDRLNWDNSLTGGVDSLHRNATADVAGEDIVGERRARRQHHQPPVGINPHHLLLDEPPATLFHQLANVETGLLRPVGAAEQPGAHP
jgi:hypothetical protein